MARTSNFWYHMCKRRIFTALGLEIEKCPYCGITEKEANRHRYTEEAPAAHRQQEPSVSAAEDAD
jgi:hypothetical protein